MDRFVTLAGLAAAVLVAGCQTTNDSLSSGPPAPPQHFTLIACVDAYGSEQVRGYQLLLEQGVSLPPTLFDANAVLDRAFDRCDEAWDEVVESVVATIKRKNRWRSVRASVRPAIKDHVKQTLMAEMAPAYSTALDAIKRNS